MDGGWRMGGNEKWCRTQENPSVSMRKQRLDKYRRKDLFDQSQPPLTRSCHMICHYKASLLLGVEMTGNDWK